MINEANLILMRQQSIEDRYISAVEKLVDVVTEDDPRFKELKKDSFEAFQLALEPRLKNSYLAILEHKILLVEEFAKRLSIVKGLAATKKEGESTNGSGIQTREQGQDSTGTSSEQPAGKKV